MRDFFKDNFVMKRIHRAPKNLCQLSQHAFSKTVQLWSLCRTVRGEITCTKGVVLSKEAIFDGKVMLENVEGMPPKIYATFPRRYSLNIYRNS